MAPVRHLDALGSEALEAALVENAPIAWEEGALDFSRSRIRNVANPGTCGAGAPRKISGVRLAWGLQKKVREESNREFRTLASPKARRSGANNSVPQ